MIQVVTKAEAEGARNGTSSDANQETEQAKTLSAKDSSDDQPASGDSKTETNAPGKNPGCSIEVKVGVNGKSRNRENSEAENVCRICHFGTESSSDGSELIELGCDCKGELGWSHPRCAEAWFSQKGDRLCEICGTTAKNVDDKRDDTSIFLMEWNEMRLVAATLDDSQASSQRCKRSLCRVLAVCLVLAFLLPWLFRGIHVL